MWLTPARAASMAERRRHLVGATGCGLCGLESLSETIRPLPPVPAGGKVTADQIAAAMAALGPAQSINHRTSAVHAAGFWDRRDGLILVREDVGRHNALDKLAGALARRGLSADRGLVLLTSRVSVEMVQKAAFMGAPIVVAVSAPTGLAVRSAEAAGITLVAIARADGFEVFTHRLRIG